MSRKFSRGSRPALAPDHPKTIAGPSPARTPRDSRAARRGSGRPEMPPGGRSAAQLVASGEPGGGAQARDLLGVEETPLSCREGAEPDRTHGEPPQAPHRMADQVHHPHDLVLLPFV